MTSVWVSVCVILLSRTVDTLFKTYRDIQFTCWEEECARITDSPTQYSLRKSERPFPGPDHKVSLLLSWGNCVSVAPSGGSMDTFFWGVFALIDTHIDVDSRTRAVGGRGENVSIWTNLQDYRAMFWSSFLGSGRDVRQTQPPWDSSSTGSASGWQGQEFDPSILSTPAHITASTANSPPVTVGGTSPWFGRA